MRELMDRKRKIRFLALALSLLMVLTTVWNGVPAYAGYSAVGQTRDETEISVQKATASETSQLNKATASEPEKTDKKQKTDSASKDKIDQDEISEADLYRMSDEGTLTREVLCELGAIEPTEKIDVETYFQFTCIVDDEDDQTHTNLKTYVMDKLHITELTPGALENVAPKTVFFNEQNHMYRRAVVGNTPVYYVGIVNVDGTSYVYYVTSQKNSDRASYSVLKPGEKIDLLYVHKNSYQIRYELENERTDAPDSDLTADEVFGGDRMEVVEENGSYTFKVKIPRGYQATVEVVDSDEAQVALKGSDPSLGRMMSYYKKAENPNRILLKEDSPSSMILNGTYEVGPVTKDQTVRVKYHKVDTFTFSAVDWSGTVYAKNGRVYNSVPESWTGTFQSGKSFVWTFLGFSTGGSTFEMDQLELNGEAIEVPMVTLEDTQTVETTTTLSTGTVVTISVYSNHGKNGSSAIRYYTVTISNCYEDITVSGGNMVGHSHKEIVVRRLTGGTAQYAVNGTAPSAQNGWQKMKSDTLILRAGAAYRNDTFRFKTDTGFGKPDIRIFPKDALSKLQENGDNNYIEYLFYSGPGAAGEIRSYQEWLPSYDGYYYFRTTNILTAYMNHSYAQGVVLLEIQGIPLKVGVAYVSGGDQTDANGNLLSPDSANIVNMPGFDSGGTNGYNTVNNPYVPISTLIPRDLSGKFEFDHWQIVRVNADGTLGDVKENAVYATGQMAHLTTDTFHNLADCSRWDEREQRSVFTLQAVWKSNNVSAPINYAVHYYVDGQEIYTETHTANKGAKVIVDAWNSGTGGLSEAVLGVLQGTNNARKDYTDKGTVRYFIDRGISTTELQHLQQDNNALHIYFVTADIKWTIRKQWLYTATGVQTAPTGTIRAQIQRKTADGSGWENVSSPDGVIELTSAGSWKTETGNLPLYKNDNVAEPYTYRVVELDSTNNVVEEGNKVSFPDPANTAVNREFLVNYQKQGKVWTILNAETPTGALKVSNTISGAQGDQTRFWEFTVRQKVSDASEPLLNGMFGGMNFTDGVARFTLKHGESMIGVGFSAGTKFTVSETGANKDGYISTCNKIFLQEQGNDFAILADQTVSADILNAKDLSSVSVFLKALKYVNNATPSDAQQYTFYLKDASGRQLQSVKNVQAAVNFQKLEYSEAGTYTYYLMEANDGKADVQYSELVYEADVEVTEGETSEGHKLAAAVTYRIPGGGIVSGTPEFMNRVNEASLTSVRVIKHWSDNESEFRPQTVKFQLYKKTGADLEPQGDPVEVSADANGIWSYTWGNLDKNTEWEVAEVEIPEKYEIASAYMENNEWIITNRLKSSDVPTAKNVTVRKVWEDQDSTKRPAVVNVQLYKDLIPYETVTLSADNNWQFTWTDLDASAEWTVDEIDVPEGYERSIRTETSDDQAVTTYTITNKQVTEEPKPPVQEKISITANKVWEDAGYAGRPQSVKLQLYCDGEAYGDAVTVSQDQGWRYVWTDLEKDHVWTVGEAENVSGYNVSVTHDGNEWVITNTRKASGNNSGNNSGSSDSDDDSDHDSGNSGNNSNAGVVDNKGTAVDDTTSRNGTDPSEAAGNTDTDGKTNGNAAAVAPPDAFVKSGRLTPGSADAAVADAKNMRKKDRNVPETGDVTHGYLWFLLAGISLTGILALILGKEHSDRKRKS